MLRQVREVNWWDYGPPPKASVFLDCGHSVTLEVDVRDVPEETECEDCDLEGVNDVSI
jgi:hypothetical protein